MRIKSIISSSIGNIIEWYDFGLFAIFSPTFSKLFFPTTDPHVALVMTFGVLALGFFCRPLGALIFGYLGDKRGRAKTLRLSILMISIPTLLIGCLPTYASTGILAPILLIMIRMWQGISLGGEYSGSLIYLTEAAPKNRRATLTSLIPMGANFGILLASLVVAATSYFFSEDQFVEFGWRLPYLISGVLSLVIYFTRLKIEETPVFCEMKRKHLIQKNPVKFVLRHNIPQILRTIGMVCMGSTFYYLCFIYMPTFLIENLHYSITKASVLMTCFIASMLVFVPVGGMLCDRVGRRRLLLFNAVFIAVFTIPGFYLLLKNSAIIFPVIFVLSIFTLASSLEQATTCVSVVENYPAPARFTGLSVGYNISTAIFGGTAPLVCQWLSNKTQLTLAPAFYIVICALITLMVVSFSVKETRGCDLV